MTARAVVRQYAATWRIPYDRLIGKNVAPFLVAARRDLYRVLRDHGFTWVVIGAAVGNRHHSTVLKGASRR